MAEKRLIDANALIEYSLKGAETVAKLKEKCLNEPVELGAYAYFSEQERMYRYDIPNLIRNFTDDCAPTIDAVEVVRCKNCIHKDTEDCPMSQIVDDDYTWLTDIKAQYCSYGEVKQ